MVDMNSVPSEIIMALIIYSETPKGEEPKLNKWAKDKAKELYKELLKEGNNGN